MSEKKDQQLKPAPAPANGNPPPAAQGEECFVIMPISDPDGYEPGHFRRVYEDLFVPSCADAGYRAVRADEVRQTNLIHLDVLQKIVESPMALCDLSSRNPNVLFELGLRQAFDKPVVLVQEVGTPPIFDINPLRYTTYRKEMLYRQVIEDQRELTAAIAATKEDIGNAKSINSIVKLLSLTRAASLTNISEGDRESAMLQVVMAELSNIRSEMARARRDAQPPALAVPAANTLNLRLDAGAYFSDIASNLEALGELLLPLKLGDSPPTNAYSLITRTIALLRGANLRAHTSAERERWNELSAELDRIREKYKSLVGAITLSEEQSQP